MEERAKARSPALAPVNNAEPAATTADRRRTRLAERTRPAGEPASRRAVTTSARRNRSRLGRGVDAMPQRNGEGHSQSTLQSRSPLPDSNRRPLPYHRRQTAG